MTKEQFLSAINDIDDKFIKEITNAPDILDKPQENYFADEQPQVVYLTYEHIPFWKVALSAAAAVCVLTAGLFTAAKLRAPVTSSPNDSTKADSSGVTLPNASESSLPVITTIPKIKLVTDEGYDFKFTLTGDRAEQNISVPVQKNDNEDYAVFYINCRGVSEENPLRIWIFLTRNGETVKRVCSFDVTKDGEQWRTVPYEDYKVTYGEECVIQVFSNGGAYMDGKWLP